MTHIHQPPTPRPPPPDTLHLPSDVGNLRRHPPDPQKKTQWQNPGLEIFKKKKTALQKKKKKETISRRIICAWLEIKADDSSTGAQCESELFHTASGTSSVLSVAQTFRPAHKGHGGDQRITRQESGSISQKWRNVHLTGGSFFSTKDLGARTRAFSKTRCD